MAPVGGAEPSADSARAVTQQPRHVGASGHPCAKDGNVQDALLSPPVSRSLSSSAATETLLHGMSNGAVSQLSSERDKRMSAAVSKSSSAQPSAR